MFIIYIRYEFYLKKVVCRGLQKSRERIKWGFQRQIIREIRNRLIILMMVIFSTSLASVP